MARKRKQSKRKRSKGIGDFGMLQGSKEFGGGFDVPKVKATPQGFDDTFGLDFDFSDKLSNAESPKKLFGDMGFTEEFKNSENEESMVQNDPFVPEIISENFDEPAENMGFEQDPMEETLLFAQLPKVRLGTPIPKTDPELSRSQKLERKFSRVRQEALSTGGNPISPEEEREFSQVGPTRNFGTTGRRATGRIG